MAKKRKLPAALKAHQFKKKAKTGRSAKSAKRGRSGRSRRASTGSFPGISAGKKSWGSPRGKKGTGTVPGLSGGKRAWGSQKRSATAGIKGARPKYRNSAG